MTLKKAVIFVGRELYITLTSHSRCLSAGADKLTGAELLLDQAELRHVGECESLRESKHPAGDIGSSVRPAIVTDRVAVDEEIAAETVASFQSHRLYRKHGGSCRLQWC